MSEVENSPKKYGFRIDTITPDFMSNVVRIYEETAGKTDGSQRFSQRLGFEVDRIKNELIGRGFCERRLGSQVDFHSKLVNRSARKQDLYYFEFSPNLDSNERDNEGKKTQADEIRQKFRSKINEYLISSCLGSELKF